jgi:hypothetical protein
MAVAIVDSSLVLKRASAFRPLGEWNEDDFDVLADGAVVGRIFKANAAPVGAPWMWTTHGYTETREAAMAAGMTERQLRLTHRTVHPFSQSRTIQVCPRPPVRS